MLGSVRTLESFVVLAETKPRVRLDEDLDDKVAVPMSTLDRLQKPRGAKTASMCGYLEGYRTRRVRTSPHRQCLLQVQPQTDPMRRSCA